MRRDETLSKGSSPISRCSATQRRGVGSAVVDRRKLFVNWFLYLKPGRLQPLSSPANRAVESPPSVSSSIALSHLPAPQTCYEDGNRNAMNHASGDQAVSEETGARSFPIFPIYNMR